jgi:hypothetical protein
MSEMMTGPSQNVLITNKVGQCARYLDAESRSRITKIRSDQPLASIAGRWKRQGKEGTEPGRGEPSRGNGGEGGTATVSRVDHSARFGAGSDPLSSAVNLRAEEKGGCGRVFPPAHIPHPQLLYFTTLRPAYTFLPLPLITHFYVLSDTPMAHDHFNSGFFASQPQRAPELVKRESPELPHALKLPTFAVSSDIQHQVAGGAYAPGIAYGALAAPSAVLPFTMPTLFDPGSQDDDDIEESDEFGDRSRPSTSISGAFGDHSMKRDDRVVRRRSSKGAPVLNPYERRATTDDGI